MCGHVGIAGKLEHKDENFMRRLLLFDYFRGPDSTGLAAVRSTREVHTAKIASNPLDLFDSVRFKTALSGNMSDVFLGHNRAATRGVVNNHNAHPYTYGPYTGAHNGTLEWKSAEELNKRLGVLYTVDSMAIFDSFERFGIEETVKELTGAWSFVWYDKADHSLNFLRNKERPMWVGYTKEFDKIMWASEWATMDAAYRHSSPTNEMYAEDKTRFRFWSTDEDIWYKYDLTELKKGSDSLPEPVFMKEVKGKEAKPIACGAPPFGTGQNTTGHTTKTTTSPTSENDTANRPGSEDPNCLHVVTSDALPLAGWMSEGLFNDWAKYGCSWCGHTVKMTDPGLTIFEREEVILCPDCSPQGGMERTRIIVDDLELVQAL